jgi:hypothetical protein
VFLCSTASDDVNGQIISVDSGMFAVLCPGSPIRGSWEKQYV